MKKNTVFIKNGVRFTSMEVLEEVESRRTPCGSLKRMFRCRCDCGKIFISQLNNIRSGMVKSCGCKRNEYLRTASLTHGKSHSPTHGSWSDMFQRCNNKNNKNYTNYGGRGIRVCKRWYTFENFLFDMGERLEGMSIDRINNNGNYEKKNCRWADKWTQANNKSTTRRIIHKGESLSMSEWARKINVNPVTILARIKSNWPTKDLLIKKNGRYLKRTVNV